jgi:SAM-dependent methyltransferase
MSVDIHREIFEGFDRTSPGRLELIRRAFRMLPKCDRPRILDVGCGRGGPTLELARLSDGQVIGLDIDGRALNDLEARSAEEGLSARVRVMNCSMSEMEFEEGTIDIIWAEGSIHVIGFETALDAWRRFLAREGCIVIHEMAWLRPDPPTEITDHWRKVHPGIRTVPEYVAEIPRHGYHPIGHFAVPEGFWWVDYYRPLEVRLNKLREKHKDDRCALRILEEQQRETDLYKKYGRWYGSAYLLMQKRAG